MQDSALLGQLVLGHSPLITRERAVVATRLTVFPERREGPPDAEALLQALLSVWPAPASAPAAEGDAISLTLRPLTGAETATPAAAVAEPARTAAGAPTRATPLSLNIASEPWLRAMMSLDLPPHIMVEVPAFMVCDPTNAAALQRLHAGGSALLVKGRPATDLPRELLPCFRHSLIDVSEERRTSTVPPPGAVRTISFIQSGIRSQAELDAAFDRGAVAVLGWPLEDQLQMSGGPRHGGPDLQVVMELMKRVDREEPVQRLEAVLKNDPQLAFRLIRYLNSAAFGLSVEISSFRHALMMLGYKKLKRWLALLLASASKDPAMKPVMHAAVRRGTLMEELGRSSGDDEMRSEMFICGVFSLLDRMLGQTFGDLFKTVPVPERVLQALVNGSGPFQPYLALVRAVESGSRTDIRECADQTFVGLVEVNSAVLRALAAAQELD